MTTVNETQKQESTSYVNGAYDMVLAVSEGAINAQFATIFKKGIMNPDKAILPKKVEWELDTDRFLFKVSAKVSAPPFVKLSPLAIGRELLFHLKLSEITVSTSYMSRKTKKEVTESTSCSDWTLVFKAELTKLDYHSIKDTCLDEKTRNRIDAILTQQLKHAFDISALVVDFSNVYVSSFVAELCIIPDMPTDIEFNDRFYSKLCGYLRNLSNDEKYFIIGVSAEKVDQGKLDYTPSLIPSTIGHSTYGNKDLPQLSSLNYLVTSGPREMPDPVYYGHFKNPLLTSTACSGKMLISRKSLVEERFISNLKAATIFTKVYFMPQKPEPDPKPKPLSLTYGYDMGGGQVWETNGYKLSTFSYGSFTIVLDRESPKIDVTVVLTINTVYEAGDFDIPIVDWKIKNPLGGRHQRWDTCTYTGSINFRTNREGHGLDSDFHDLEKTDSPPIYESDEAGKFSDFLSLFQFQDEYNKWFEGKRDTARALFLNSFNASLSELGATFIPPTGDHYTLSPKGFDENGHFIVEMNYETH